MESPGCRGLLVLDGPGSAEKCNLHTASEREWDYILEGKVQKRAGVKTYVPVERSVGVIVEFFGVGVDEDSTGSPRGSTIHLGGGYATESDEAQLTKHTTALPFPREPTCSAKLIFPVRSSRTLPLTRTLLCCKMSRSCWRP